MAYPLFFGVWRVAGHFLVGPGGRGHDLSAPEAYALGRSLDGVFAPRVTGSGLIVSGETRNDSRDRERFLASECPQGQFLRHRHGRWSLLQWWDRCQGDSRPMSNSTVLLDGDRTTEELLAALSTYFPNVLGNLAAHDVKLVEVFLSPP